MNIQCLNIQSLHIHESTDPKNIVKVKHQIEQVGCFTEPIIVDAMHLVVLDGHHRLKSCKLLGLTKIPCMMVDYLHDTSIHVQPRRKNIPVTKETVIRMGLSPHVFPRKTTRHTIPHRVTNLRIPLTELM